VLPTVHTKHACASTKPFQITTALGVTNFGQVPSGQLVSLALVEMSRSARHEGRHGVVFEVTARLKVRDGELEGFKQKAAEVMKATKELDTKTVRYDWFLSEDGTECEVRESYSDADARIEHSQHIAAARNQLFRDFADDHTVAFYAEPSPELTEALKAMPPGAVTLKQFSLFQALDTEAAEEVPA